MSRQEQIIQLLRKEGYLEVEKLCAQLDVSPATIRRDLVELEDRALIKRTHGGAMLVQAESMGLAPDPLLEAKQRLARKAVEYIKPGMTVFMDSGSTTMEVARLMLSISDIFVITNSINIAHLLYTKNTGSSVFVCGGSLSTDGEGRMADSTAEMAVSNFRADLLIMGALSVDIKRGITDPYIPVANIKRKMIERSAETLLVVDHSKFGRVSKAFVAEANSVTRVVTDSSPAPDVVQYYAAENIPLIIAS